MSEASPSPVMAADSSPWNPDNIFSMLVEAPRRRVLQALASGGAISAIDLAGTAGVRPDATLKHLAALRTAGLLSAAPDRVDKRRMLYSLSPSMTVVKTATGTAIDFGCCLLVCGGKIEIAGVLPVTGPGGKD